MSDPGTEPETETEPETDRDRARQKPTHLRKVNPSQKSQLKNGTFGTETETDRARDRQ